MAHKAKPPTYIRIGIYRLDEVLPFIFDKNFRKILRQQNVTYKDEQWKNSSKRIYNTTIGPVNVAMGSQRYEMFSLKGVTCVTCGIVGRYFALESCYNDNPMKPHFNLYGINNKGHEVMLTKDHIIPRSKGGKNIMKNYQPMCIKCNSYKADKDA